MQVPARLGPYRVVREVARGGMGVVYLGEDPGSHPVALKLLIAGQAATALQRRRAATEIQSLRRLRHPHVVGLLDAGEHAGVPWLALEWVEGESLAERIKREGPLAPGLAVDLVVRLAHALEHCHAQGVVHRDLKPDNVLLRARDGAPLLTDFGLSKDVASASQGSLSHVGLWLGTPGYWPPEQARGNRAAIGPRSDVYGLGALLYATLTGAAPQEGETLLELIASLERLPTPPGQRRPGIPAWLDAVCLRALETDPERRHASAAELARELEAGQAGARASAGEARQGPASRARLAGALAAVLLVTAGAGIATRHLASAVPAPRHAPPMAGPPTRQAPSEPARGGEELRSELARLRASSEARHGAGDRAGALGDLNRLIELAPRDAQAHADRAYLRKEAGDVAGAHADLDRALELNPLCAQAYLVRALLRSEQGDPAGARSDYDRTIELNPGSAQAHTGRSWLRNQEGDVPGARADLDRAIELDPSLSQAWSNRASVRLMQGDPEGAERDSSRAVDLDPRNTSARFNRAYIRATSGDPTGALEDFSRVIELDPRHAAAHASRAGLRLGRGDRAGARADVERALELDPRLSTAYGTRAALHLHENDPTSALADYERALELDPRNADALANRGALRLQQGDLTLACVDLDRALELWPRHAPTWLSRGAARYKLGDLAGALYDCERFLELAPRDPAAPGVLRHVERIRQELAQQRDGPGSR